MKTNNFSIKSSLLLNRKNAKTQTDPFQIAELKQLLKANKCKTNQGQFQFKQ